MLIGWQPLFFCEIILKKIIFENIVCKLQLLLLENEFS